MSDTLAPAPDQPKAAGRSALRSLNFTPRFWVSIVLIVLVALFAFVGDMLYPYGSNQRVGSLFDEPTPQHILGTDNFGYDVVALLMASTRNSLYNGLLAGTIATFLGVFIGILAGYIGGWFEEFLMGVTNIVLAIPAIVVLILISVSIQGTNLQFLKGIIGMSLVIGFTSWPWTARSVRAQASSVATREHIDVAKLSGARTFGILLRDVLPYLASYVVMAWVLQVASAILAESTLSMLGLGPSGTASLGVELHWALAFNAVANRAWWAFLPPTAVLTIISFALLYLQSSLDEVFNPRLRRGKKKNLAKAAERRAEAARRLAAEIEAEVAP
ncbi:MAG: ABC transporter permease [Propionibacteriaceae bacterium]|jgi:peptide/nickel transport system permease protein|nr:ABC transporter permease [Propionibacteriaceae bacterium]